MLITLSRSYCHLPVSYRSLVDQSGSLGSCKSPRGRWEGNIRMDLEEIGIHAGNWVDLAQDGAYWRALVNATLNLQVP